MRRGMAVVGAVIVVLALGGCSDSGGGNDSGSAGDDAAPTTSGPELRLNDVQVIGSHNSYHREPRKLIQTLQAKGNHLADMLEYTHPSLTEQLERDGVRQVELDVFADTMGGAYADKHTGADAETMRAPGFKVLHSLGIDTDSSCLTLELCLGEIEAWSEAHPDHLPVAVLVEFKEESIAVGAAGRSRADLLDDLDAEIESVVPTSGRITPDDARGSHSTLDAMVKADDWPTLEASRGKLLFALDNESDLREVYRAPSPILEGRAMFTSSQPGSPDAAFTNTHGAGMGAKVRRLVAGGYLVRARADGDTQEARSGDTTHRDEVLRNGATYVSTDYFRPDTRFGTGYGVALPGGGVARCNPVSAPAGCARAQLAEH